MSLNLPPDPNDPPAQWPGSAPVPPQDQRQAPAYAAPAFPDGSRGAPYREPLVVTRRNNGRVALWVFAAVLLVVVVGGVGLVFVVLASGILY